VEENDESKRSERQSNERQSNERQSNERQNEERKNKEKSVDQDAKKQEFVKEKKLGKNVDNYMILINIKITLYFNMRFHDILLATMILSSFLACYFVSYVMGAYLEIKNNWVKYRCDPIIMPFAGFFGHDTGKNFSQCIGTLQSSNMDYFMGPINAAHGAISSNVSSISGQLDSVRSLQSKLRPNIGGQFTNIFGIFNNLMIQMQKFTIGFRDMVMKILGTLTVIMHMMQGQFLLGKSAAAGPITSTPVQIIKSIGQMV
jgi:hypothetical protein